MLLSHQKCLNLMKLILYNFNTDNPDYFHPFV